MTTIDTIVIPVGGRGVRLLPLTQERPKPLLPYRGKPILQAVLDVVLSMSWRRVILVTGYLAPSIDRFLANEYCLPQHTTATIETRYNADDSMIPFLKANAAEIDGAFVYSDGNVLYTRDLLPALLAAHRGAGSAITVAASPLHQAQTHLQLWIDESGICKLAAGRSGSRGSLCSLGTFVIEPEFMTFLQELDPPVTDLDDAVESFFQAGGAVQTYVYQHRWIAIHTADDLVEDPTFPL